MATSKGAAVFDEITGLPVHPLAVHAAIVLIPLSGLLGVLFAVPRTRDWARVPLLLVSLAAVAATYVARESGEALERVGGQGASGSLGGPIADLVNDHQQASDVLWWLVIGYAAVAVAALVLTRERTTGITAHGVAAVLVVVALVMGFFTYRVGELGARAVWNPTDSADYSS